MKSSIIAILLGLLFAAGLRAAPTPDAPAYVFQIPSYPGTEVSNGSIPSLNVLMLPFGTVVKIYRTRSGKPLDADAVIAFYREYFERKGWKEGIFKRQDREPYLALTTQVYENPTDGTHIQAAAEFYLWLAPKDGMFTVYMRHHRISQADNSTRKSLSDATESLQHEAESVGYGAHPANVETGWEEAYGNEYLIDRKLFVLVSKQFRGPRHPDESKLIQVSFMTFRDAGIAEIERDIQQKMLQGRFGYGVAATKGKLLILLYDASGQQTRIVDQIMKAVVNTSRSIAAKSKANL